MATESKGKEVPGTRWWTIEGRLSTYYAIMFGAVGLTGPFFAPWLQHLGVSPTLTGLTVALPLLAMVLTTVYIGSLADRLNDWRIAIITSDWLVLFLFSWMLIRQDIIDIIIIWTLTGLVIAAKVPIADAATLSLTRRRGTEYSQIRAIGSVGFVIALLLGGYLIDTAGYGWFVPLLLIGSLLRALSSISLPHFRSPSTLIPKTADERLSAPAGNLAAPSGNLTAMTVGISTPMLASPLGNPGFLLVICGAALINASHAYFTAFGMILWLDRGISASMTSILWSAAVIAEIILMWCFARVSRRFSARYCMLAAGAAGLVRWSLSTLELDLIWLIPIQSLHALSYGLMFMATVNFIARRVDDSIAARAQALFATVSTAALSIGLFVSGLIYSAAYAQGYWLMTCLCVAGLLLILLSYFTPMVGENR